jgi:hypothetical protein
MQSFVLSSAIGGFSRVMIFANSASAGDLLCAFACGS